MEVQRTGDFGQELLGQSWWKYDAMNRTSERLSRRLIHDVVIQQETVCVDNELYVRVPSSEADSRGSCVGLIDQARELGITKVFACLDRSMRQNFVNLVKEYESEGFEYFQHETSVSPQQDIFNLMVFDLQQ